MGVKYVKEFEFGPQKTYVAGYCRGGKAKMASGGTVVEKATGERYPSKMAMEKHERLETPRMQREELIQKATVRNAARPPQGGVDLRPNQGALGVIANKNPGQRRGMPVAPATPMISPMKKGGAVPKAGAYKMPKVMNEFKAGELHSGSKKGPIVTNPKQAIAIAMSEARTAAKRKK